MREIKFRVWDKLIKKMITDENVKEFLGENFGSWNKNQPYDSAEWYPAYEILAVFRYFKDIVDYTIEPYETKSEKRFEIMQYTGLKDVNGKEIYEGDIVLINKEKNIKGIVKYSETYAEFEVVNTNNITDEYEPLADYKKHLEILGNEYENPELLEKVGD